MSWGKRAKAMDIDPAPFESKIMDLERKRFGIKKYDPYGDNDRADDLFDEYQKKKIKHRKRKIKNQDDDFARDDNILRGSKRNMNIRDDLDSHRSSTGSFERYKTDLSSRKSTNTKVDQITRFSSTPQLGSKKHRNILNGKIHEPHVNANYDVDRKLDYLNNSHGVSPLKRKSHNDNAVEGHRQFRNLAFDDESKKTNASPKKFTTPRKSASMLSRAHRDRELERDIGSTITKPKTVLFDESQNDIRLFDDTNYDTNHEINPSTKDGLNTYMRTFLFKELDKIRHD
jgi:hypothetical protein